MTCPASDDAVVVYLTGLTLSNHERQVHVVRGRRAAERPPHPDLKPDNQSCQGEGAGGS